MSRRAGLSRDRVVDAAAALVEAQGVEALTLTALAEQLGVRTPSLYKHIASLDDLRDGVVQRAAASLADRLEAAALGRSRDEAARRVARAWRAFGREHPHLHALLPPDFLSQPPAVRAEGERLLRVTFAVFSGYDLEGDDLVHVVRAFRAAVTGFVTLEAAGGFAMGADVEVSFERLLEVMLAGVAR